MQLPFRALAGFSLVAGRHKFGQPFDFYFKPRTWSWEGFSWWVPASGAAGREQRFASTFDIRSIDVPNRCIELITADAHHAGRGFHASSFQELEKRAGGKLFSFEFRRNKPVFLREQAIGRLSDLILGDASFLIAMLKIEPESLDPSEPTLYDTQRVVELNSDGSLVLRENDALRYDVPANLPDRRERERDYQDIMQQLQGV